MSLTLKRYKCNMPELNLLFGTNKNSFKKLFNSYYQPLCHLGRHYLGDEDEAKTVVQEAFVKLWEVRHELESGSNIQNYLFTLVKNNCLNILKRRQILLKHHEKIQEKELRYQYESLNRISDDYLEFKELKEKIDAAIKNLPEHLRVVFELSRFKDMKNREIALELEISQKTVEARMTKALKILREELKDYLPLIMILPNFLD
ncbi:RNA polymerase sigma-70 factor [Maribellus luteus]|uniref:RNA polymerase sigma-70 factor n=1 Tax=Maribellus luteus TaxID=2305463 RepID=A0A399ST96_9BACT|nr:RNA polymerase sigma-70 factor [Maribellus luteus]RIJ45363.1 RNA polymerase sigma-70 factor [Maribellus luteus]